MECFRILFVPPQAPFCFTALIDTQIRQIATKSWTGKFKRPLLSIVLSTEQNIK